MASQPIDCIVESLVTGDLDVHGFMRAVQKRIEDLEAESGAMDGV
jgi:hypothetical protein